MFKELEKLFSTLVDAIKARVKGVEDDITAIKTEIEALKGGDLSGVQAAIEGLRSGAIAVAAPAPNTSITTVGSATITVDPAAGTTTAIDASAGTTTVLDHATGDATATHDATGATVAADLAIAIAARDAAAAAGVTVPSA